jgi:hypothetical protein
MKYNALDMLPIVSCAHFHANSGIHCMDAENDDDRIRPSYVQT